MHEGTEGLCISIDMLGLGPVPPVKFHQFESRVEPNIIADPADVRFHGAFCDSEHLADVAVSPTSLDQYPQHIDLAFRQTELIEIDGRCHGFKLCDPMLQIFNLCPGQGVGNARSHQLAP